MVSDKNRRYSKPLGDLSCAPRDPILERGSQPHQWFNEGDVPQSSDVTVEATTGSALITFFQCGCGRQGRFSPADMRRRNLDPKATLWSLAKKMKCTSCNRRGVITRISRVRVSGANPKDDL